MRLFILMCRLHLRLACAIWRRAARRAADRARLQLWRRGGGWDRWRHGVERSRTARLLAAAAWASAAGLRVTLTP